MNGMTTLDVPLKKCTQCGEIKEASLGFFIKRLRAKDGLTSECKKCHYIRCRKWRKENPVKNKEMHKKWFDAHPEKHKLYRKKAYLLHPDRRKKAVIKWQKKNPDKCKEFSLRSYKKKRINPKVKLSDSIRRRINSGLQKGSKGECHWEALVGYTVDQLKTHLETLFTEGMSWKNYGKHGWHVDHKIPLAAHNFSSPDDIDFKKAWALSNLQPLWAFDNISKKDKVERPFQPSLLINV